MERKKILADDLYPGNWYKVGNQGVCMAPVTVWIKLHWVGVDTVHYIKEGFLYSTSIERMLSILNESAIHCIDVQYV